MYEDDEEDKPRDSPARREAILEAEIRSLQRTLANDGVLGPDKLEERSGATAWAPGAFAEALAAGISRGVLRRRGDDLIELPEEQT